MTLKMKETPPVLAGGNGKNGKSIEKKIDDYLDMNDIFSITPDPVDYVLPGLVAGTVGALVSPGATGKSLLALQLAMKIATGWDTLVLPETATGHVTYLATEDPHIIMHHRLHAMGKNLTEEQKQAAIEKMHVALVSGVNIFNPAWYSKLTKTAEGQRLVILDVLRRFHGEDENNTSAMTRLLGVLEGICGKTDATILFLHHATKAAILAGMGDLQQASRGSSVLTDNTRWQAYLTAMTAAEAKKYHIPEGDRKKYVRFGIAKQNYDRPFDDIWLEKNYSKGIMERAYLQEIQEVKKNEKTW